MKGASPFCIHPPFDLVKGFVVDPMHTVFLGVSPKLLSYWFGHKSTSKEYCIRNKVLAHNKLNFCIYLLLIFVKLRECDMKLLSIRVPDIISRQPKTLYEYDRWKGIVINIVVSYN